MTTTAQYVASRAFRTNIYSELDPCADPESFIRGGPIHTFF